MKLLVTGKWYEAKLHLDELNEMGHDVYFLEEESDALPCDPAIVEGMVCHEIFIWHPLEEFTNLRLLQLDSAGYDYVPMEELKARGVEVHNVGATYAGPMSEYVICHLLDWYHNVKQEMENRENRGWNKNREKQELTGRTVCIIGTGNVAKLTARKLQAFDCTVIGITHTARDVEYMNEVRTYERLHETLAEADIVVLAAPPSGASVISSAELDAMKPEAVLVNVSRGSLVDEAALEEALRTGQIAAAILDVFREEPLPAASGLWELDNAIITPHLSFLGTGNAERLWQVIKKVL